jgi:putative hydrolase of the HAD superfamily
MEYKWLLFDLDGTLFDYNSAEKNALKMTFQSHIKNYSDEYLDTYRTINKKIWTDFENGLITQKEIKAQRFKILGDTLSLSFDAEKFSSDYLDNLSQQTQLIEGAEDVLGQLHTKYQFALVTNGLTQVQRPRIKSSTIANYFSEVIISEEIGFAKPDQAFFDITFERIGHPPREDVMIIGDSLTSDMLGGTRYSITTCWFNPDGLEAGDDVKIDYEISSLSNLLSILNINP